MAIKFQHHSTGFYNCIIPVNFETKMNILTHPGSTTQLNLCTICGKANCEISLTIFYLTTICTVKYYVMISIKYHGTFTKAHNIVLVQLNAPKVKIRKLYWFQIISFKVFWNHIFMWQVYFSPNPDTSPFNISSYYLGGYNQDVVA